MLIEEICHTEGFPNLIKYFSNQEDLHHFSLIRDDIFVIAETVAVQDRISMIMFLKIVDKKYFKHDSVGNRLNSKGILSFYGILVGSATARHGGVFSELSSPENIDKILQKQATQKVTGLDFVSCFLNDADIPVICAVIRQHPEISHVILSLNQITIMSAPWLTELLQLPQLQSLEILNNPISTKDGVPWFSHLETSLYAKLIFIQIMWIKNGDWRRWIQDPEKQVLVENTHRKYWSI